MANVDRVNGLIPVGHTTTGSYNGQSREYAVASTYATALYVGDPVLLTGTGNTDGVPYVALAAVNATSITGVIVGFKVDRANLSTEHPGYSAASTEDIVLVADDPEVIFECQEDGNMGVVGIGGTLNHVNAGGNTTTGTSGVELDSSDLGIGASFRVLGASRKVDNEPANANAKWLVQINEHTRKAAVAGV